MPDPQQIAPTQDPWAVVSQTPVQTPPAATSDQADQWKVVSQTPAPTSMGPQQSGATAEGISAGLPAEIRPLTMPLVKGLIAAHDKLREVENLTQEGQQAHPIQAHIGNLANRIEGLLTGNTEHPEAGIGTGEYGMLTNPVTASILPGEGGTPMLAEGLEQGAGLAKKGYQAAKELVTSGKATEEPNIIAQAIKGKTVAQEPAKAAIRSATGASDEAKLLEGNKTVVDEHLSNLAQKEKAAYSKMDEAAGFDVKEAKIRLKNDQYKLKQLGNTEADQNAREKLNAAIKDTSGRIADAQKKMADAGIDVSAADNLHKARMAGQEFKKALVRNLSADGETVNVDGLLKAMKNLRALSKYGDRLEQFLGKESADTFMQNLQKAQEMGAHAMKVNRIGKWLLGTTITGGMVGEAVKHILP